MSRLGDGSHAAASGRSAHEHATVRFGGSFEGSPRSTEQLAPPRAAPSAAPPVRAGAPAASATNANFLKPGGGSKLLFNEAARQQLAPYAGAAGTTVHFTFGSSVMVDFVQNWLHFARRAALKPLLVGAADAALLSFCNNKSVPAAAISPDLDVWTYERKPAQEGVYQIKTQWAYFRHHDSDFLEMGLVKVAFLWELLVAGLNVLISDLDVVWLNGHWARWMAYGGAEPPLPEASLLAAADILVSTDELNAEADLAGRRPSHGSDLNTGVVFLRCTQGSKAMVQAWRQAMLGRKGDKHLNENVNDQSLFQGVVRGAELRGGELDELLRRSGAVDRLGLAEATSTRRVYRALGGPPCLPQERCAPSSFTFGTLPMRPFSGGHTWFNQNVQDMAGHEQPRNEPITVHFTFQFGDTGTYPHGKRQRAREAALWAVDPPEYFTEGVFVALDGPTYSEAEQAAVYARFPSWSPQRHMHMDAPQRQAVRDLLGLATAVGGIPVLPSLWCHCDRYWGFLKNCRFPMVPNMNLPFNCPQDALYDPTRWAAKGVRWCARARPGPRGRGTLSPTTPSEQARAHLPRQPQRACPLANANRHRHGRGARRGAGGGRPRPNLAGVRHADERGNGGGETGAARRSRHSNRQPPLAPPLPLAWLVAGQRGLQQAGAVHLDGELEILSAGGYGRLWRWQLRLAKSVRRV